MSRGDDTKKNGMTLPTGIFQSTTLPEPVAAAARQTVPADELRWGEREDAEAEARKAAAGGGEVEDMKLYLTEDVRFRLRMLAFKRGTKISTVANEVLDKNLPRGPRTDGVGQGGAIRASGGRHVTRLLRGRPPPAARRRPNG